MPCPREGGLDNADYPCEPPSPGADSRENAQLELCRIQAEVTCAARAEHVPCCAPLELISFTCDTRPRPRPSGSTSTGVRVLSVRAALRADLREWNS
jgi:hypothetical protein